MKAVWTIYIIYIIYSVYRRWRRERCSVNAINKWKLYPATLPAHFSLTDTPDSWPCLSSWHIGRSHLTNQVTFNMRSNHSLPDTCPQMHPSYSPQVMIGGMSTWSYSLFFFFLQFLVVNFSFLYAQISASFHSLHFPPSLWLCQVAVTVMGQPACFQNQFAGIYTKYILLTGHQKCQNHWKVFLLLAETWCLWSWGMRLG